MNLEFQRFMESARASVRTIGDQGNDTGSHSNHERLDSAGAGEPFAGTEVLPHQLQGSEQR